MRRPLIGLMVVLIAGLVSTAAQTAPRSSEQVAAPATSLAPAPPAQPLKIRMGWGIPAEEIKYAMQRYGSQVAPRMGQWYTIEWFQFAGTALGVQGLAAGTLDCATVGSLSAPNGIEQGAPIVLDGRVHRGTDALLLDDLDGQERLGDQRARRASVARPSRRRRSAARRTTSRTSTSSRRPACARATTTRRSSCRSRSNRRRCSPVGSTWGSSRNRSTGGSSAPAR